MARIGVEIGGTFTDLVMLDESGRLRTVKVSSTPSMPDEGAVVAVREAANNLSIVDTIVHGSTIATNAVIERKGAPVGLIVTRGFRDLLDLQRQDRTEVYRLKYSKPQPLVPNELVREIDERVLADGTVLARPAADELRTSVAELVARGATSIAVCFLHSYRYPQHEVEAGRVIEAAWPDLPVTLSHEIAPEYREYERASTTVMSSYVRPVIDRYLARLEASLATVGFGGVLHIMQSNGGTLPAQLIRRHAVRTLLSGPAGGVTAATAVASQLGIDDLITFDMGGTSTDVCLVRGGRAEVTAEADVDLLPIRVPMFDIVTVGAGGGSIATLDAGGMLRVGPQSAGADPGPACYGRGGVQPTVTDANVVLGLIRPDRFLGGRMQLDLDAAIAACARLGEHLGSDALGAAQAIVKVANAGMLGALRLVSTERGVDPAGFWLLCYGGAGAQHAASLARDLGLRGVLVPRHPGVFSAFGLLIADLQRDWSAPFPASLAELDPVALRSSVAALKGAARAEFAAVNLDLGSLAYLVSLDMRYPGQAFELEVEVDESDLDDANALATRFHISHRVRYGHAAEAESPEIVTVRVRAVIPHQPSLPDYQGPPRAATVEPVELTLEDGRRPVGFVERDEIGGDQTISGPAVIEEEASTVWVPVDWVARIDHQGNLRLEPRHVD